MNKYEKSKIYKIETHLSDKIYIGSTTNPYLCNRMAMHRSDYKLFKAGKKHKLTSFQLFDEFGIDNCKISLIELYPCSSIDELNAREGHYIKSLECVNKQIAGRDSKQYYLDNQELFKLQSKERYKIKRKTKIECECGCRIIDIIGHKKTEKHINIMKDKELII